MPKIVYICPGTCGARIGEAKYKEGAVKCGTATCTMRGKYFEKRMLCEVCKHLYKEHETHTHK